MLEVCRRHGISKNTRQRWRAKYRGPGLAEAKRLEALEDENRRLKRPVADLSLGNALLEAIDIRSFTDDPSIGSSLKFLRRTPWARAKGSLSTATR